MRVRMLTGITGSRNGEEWPPIGGEIDLPDHEAEHMISQRYAEPVDEEDPDAEDPDAESVEAPVGDDGQEAAGDDGQEAAGDDGQEAAGDDGQEAAEPETPAEPAAEGDVTETAGKPATRRTGSRPRRGG